MEEKINVAAILKDKPQGTKLYDLLYNIDVESDTISTTDTETVVWCTNETDNNTTCHRGYSEFGTVRGCSDGLRILLPSKEMRDWSKFDWKKGDVLSCGVDNLCIFEKWANEEYTEFYAKFVTPNYSGNTFKTEKWSKETNEAVIKQYISNIEKFKGGKLNLATLEIENNQPEFKDGDIVCISGMGYLAYGIVKSIDNSSKKLEYYALNDMSTLKTDDWLSFEDKKIEEAAKQHAAGAFISEYWQACYKEGFMGCAKWMQEEFLKDLWHPSSEEPKRHSYIMFKTTNNNGFGTEYIDCSWKAIARCLQITQWLYIDDLLPKEGGNQ